MHSSVSKKKVSWLINPNKGRSQGRLGGAPPPNTPHQNPSNGRRRSTGGSGQRRLRTTGVVRIPSSHSLPSMVDDKRLQGRRRGLLGGLPRHEIRAPASGSAAPHPAALGDPGCCGRPAAAHAWSSVLDSGSPAAGVASARPLHRVPPRGAVTRTGLPRVQPPPSTAAPARLTGVQPPRDSRCGPWLSSGRPVARYHAAPVVLPGAGRRPACLQLVIPTATTVRYGPHSVLRVVASGATAIGYESSGEILVWLHASADNGDTFRCRCTFLESLF
jgi:hypothetical protein